MDDTLIREIVTRSDGVPLFAEELTKAVLDLRSLGPSAVPLTLQDSLMARLDRLGAPKTSPKSPPLSGVNSPMRC
jgi:hypothetical protein